MTIALSFEVPGDDLVAFSAETEACRKEVLRLLRVMGRLMKDEGRIGSAIAREANGLGWAPPTLRKYYDRFRHSGDWRTLIDRRRFPDPDQRGTVPGKVVDLFKKLVGENNRKDRPAYRKLMRMYQTGEVPAGYEGLIWPEYDPATDRPRGCSLRNLQRKLKDFEKVAMREGLGAALSKHGPKVLTTRIGLWVGSHFVIDDVKRDLKVLLLPHGKEAVIQEFGILDLFSGDRFMSHRRPQFRRDEDGKKDSLKEVEMRYLLAAQLRGVGFSPRGTEYVTELGTAAIREPLKKWLATHSNDKITVREPGILGKEQAIGGYWGSGGGNPRHKAALESHHNLMHNEAANLPAATGHDRNPPEWLHGVEAITEDVVKWMKSLPLERAVQLWAPMLEYWQALDLLAEIDLRIALRTDHELEGWVKCGHVRVEYCRDLINNLWIGPEEYLTLPQHAQEKLMQVAEAYPAARRVRKLAPREVFCAGAQELVRLPDHVIALMFIDRALGEDLRRSKRLNAESQFDLQDLLADPEPMTFNGWVTCPDGSTLRLDEKLKYDVVLNPFEPTQLWVYGPGGQVIGTAERVQRASRIVAAEMHHALGQRSHEIAQLLTPLRERHADTTRLIAEMQEHNKRIKAGDDVTAEEKSLARRQAKRAGSLEDLVGDEATDAPAAPAPASLKDFL